MAGNNFSFSAFLLRLLVAFLLVSLTYNPLGYSFAQWVYESVQGVGQDRIAVLVLAGLLLMIGWVIFLRATLRSLGLFGVLLATALFSSLIWVAWDFGWLSMEQPSQLSWLVIVGVAMVLGLGMSWSHVRRAMSGQIDADDVDQD